MSPKKVLRLFNEFFFIPFIKNKISRVEHFIKKTINSQSKRHSIK